MKKLILAIALVCSSNSFAHDRYGSHTCPSYLDGSGDQQELFDIWLKGFYAAKLGVEPEPMQEQIFISEFYQFCTLAPSLKLIEASNAAFKKVTAK